VAEAARNRRGKTQRTLRGQKGSGCRVEMWWPRGGPGRARIKAPGARAWAFRRRAVWVLLMPEFDMEVGWEASSHDIARSGGASLCSRLAGVIAGSSDRANAARPVPAVL